MQDDPNKKTQNGEIKDQDDNRELPAVDMPEEWGYVSSEGVGPFVTKATFKHTKGHIITWKSRYNRKHNLLLEKSHGSTWWAPGAVGWWIGVLFALGATGFVLGSTPEYATQVGNSLNNLTFFAGSLFFTTAAFLQYFEAVNAIRSPKIKIIEELGLDYVYIQDCNIEFSSLEPEIFIKSILVDTLNAASIITGYDYRFGNKAKGDTQYLKEFCMKFKIDVNIVDRVDFDNEPVSASRIRNLLDEGDIEKTNELLGRKYFIEGSVIHGKGLGSKIGFPTANLDISQNIKLPAKGVYSTKTVINDEVFYSITNIGSNPTVNNDLNNKITCETHIIGYDNLNLYGKKIIIQFEKKIRNEQKFDSLEQLKKAIENDILLVKTQLE